MRDGRSCLPDRRVAIIGAGVVGTALGAALFRCGYSISGVADVKPDAAERAAERAGGTVFSSDPIEVSKDASCVLITTPDDAISHICEAIGAGGGFSDGDVVLHCSGALSSEALASARACGASVASMHPMGVFTDVETAGERLSQLSFGIEGDASAVEVAESIVASLGGHPFRVPREQKILAHIAACFVANYTVTLADIAVQLLRHVEMSGEEAMHVLLPLLRGAVRAVEKQGLPGALSGPIARGDVATVEQHVQAIRSDREIARLYALLGLRALPIAERKGTVKNETAQRLRDILTRSLQTGLTE